MENKNKYLVYIDESNILGNIGHTVYVGVYIKYLNKDDIGQKIINIEKDLKILYTHWVDMTWKIRLKFVYKIQSLDFICNISNYKNPINQEKVLEDFLYKIIKSKSNIFRIIIDGNKGKKYEQKIKKLLKNKGIKFRKIIFIDDKKEPLLRLADFIAGSYRSYLDNTNSNNAQIYNILKHKIKILN
jgi:hypothetical protein